MADSRKCTGNTALINEVCQATGMSRAEATEKFAVFSTAIANQLRTGTPFSMFKVGWFHFKIRKGRTTTQHLRPKGNGGPVTVTSTQPDYLIVKFKAARPIRDALKQVKIPDSLRKPEKPFTWGGVIGKPVKVPKQ